MPSATSIEFSQDVIQNGQSRDIAAINFNFLKKWGARIRNFMIRGEYFPEHVYDMRRVDCSFYFFISYLQNY